MKNEQIKDLLHRYNNGQASSDEIAVVDRWVDQELMEENWEKPEADKSAFGHTLKLKIDAEIQQQEAKEAGKQKAFKVRRFWLISGIAATIALAVFGTMFFLKLKSETIAQRYANDVAPGKNAAVLTLANGAKINLDERNGTLDTLNGIKIEKAENGLVVFTVSGHSSTRDDRPNTIETPDGGQYQVVLADGTKVWLNAATVLTFPGQFAAKQKRVVKLTGEAYFEVAKDHEHPFVVQTAKQDVEVLGTHFNVNAYNNEPDTRTTLLEGSVKVSGNGQQKVLSPNQQSVLKGSALDVLEIDPLLATDWKNGEFRFKNESLESVLRKLSRWYGVRFVNELAENNAPSFTGSVSRFDHISSVLTMLEETGNIRFYINNKVITVK